VTDGAGVVLREPFRIERSLEGGAMGELLACRDARGVPFTAKLPRDGRPESQHLIEEEERRFIRHQGRFVVEYHGRILAADGRVGFAMERMDGSLAGLVARRGPLGAPRSVGYFCHAAAGLAEVHARSEGAFHGDIKLGNILYRKDIAKLADFGLARDAAGCVRRPLAHRGGTPGYLPPEAWASPAGDVYSLGMVLWAMLGGCEPPASGAVPTVEVGGKKLAALVNAMLAPEPEARPDGRALLSTLPGVRAECGVAGAEPEFEAVLRGMVAAGR